MLSYVMLCMYIMHNHSCISAKVRRRFSHGSAGQATPLGEALASPRGGRVWDDGPWDDDK